MAAPAAEQLSSWLAQRCWTVPQGLPERLCAYLDAVLEENRRVNLTALRDPEQALVLHALDSLAPAALALEPRHILDLGTGNGFPGIALGLLYPDAEVLLLDRTAKKLAAITRAAAAAGLPEPETLHGDAAQLPKLHPDLRVDCIAARAVGEPEQLGALAKPLLQPEGELLLWVSADGEAPGSLARGALTLEEDLGYDLPAPAERRRRLVRYLRS